MSSILTAGGCRLFKIEEQAEGCDILSFQSSQKKRIGITTWFSLMRTIQQWLFLHLEELLDLLTEKGRLNDNSHDMPCM
jgi:hypothetical protein